MSTGPCPPAPAGQPSIRTTAGRGHRTRLARRIVSASITVMLLGALGVGASGAHHRWSCAGQPASPQTALPVDRVRWVWTGAVTTTAATVVAEIVRPARHARLTVTTGRADPPVLSTAEAVGADGIVRLHVSGLTPDLNHRYVIEVDGTADHSRGNGRFRTMPAGPATFTVAVSSCARTGSDGAVFDAIRAVGPLLYINAGDLHYGSPRRNDVTVFGDLYRRTLTAPAQAALYRSVPIAYVWDDHDYGPDNADATAPTRPAARAAYATYVPHYPQPEPGRAVYQAFTVGRVRFILTDNRSERTATTMLGARQLTWLRQELTSASVSHAVVVWINPDPWIATPAAGADHWGGYPDERRTIADVIATARIHNLIMVSGDAHMLAVDDGSHSDYSTAGAAGFPVLQTGALDRPGSVKGGPYSHGAFPGCGQFGTITITDDATAHVRVELAGRTWSDRILVRYRTVIDAPTAAATPG
ncbi:alkaline phosphatase D family protein [Actinoplanes sp. NPDC049802]|uniref:alkaline phosphatase D family protein n=1 Tax=Actinoplanes sp. NPDC049802 TaxID=3154742 RepID=UPI0033D15DBE